MNALFALVVFALQQLVIPPPRGLVNDFAGVIDAAHAGRIERIAQYVRTHSGGEITVVTLKDLGGRDVGDIAVRIGREWKVGADAPAGDVRKNTGVVVLVVPKESAADGRGRVFIAPGRGTEGFISDGGAGDIWRAAIPDFERRDYGAALELITMRIASRFADEFKFSLDSLDAVVPGARVQVDDRRSGGNGVPAIAILVVVIFVLVALSTASRAGRYGRRSGMGSALPWIILNAMSNSRRGRHGGGGGGGGWGGGGGGGFGGFGGGGGFSGGGSGGSW